MIAPPMVAPDEIKRPPVETLPVACKPWPKFREPEKELEPVKDEMKAPAVLKEAAVTVLETVNDLERLREPAKESEPAPVSIKRPPVVRLPVAWMPRRELSEPEKELLPVLEEARVPLVMMLPPMEA